MQRSTDLAASWHSAVPLPSGEFGFVDVVSAVFNDGVLYADVDGKLYRSADLADTWQLLTAPPAGLLAGGASPAGVLWIMGSAGTYRSGDAGATWQRRHGPVDALIPSPDEAGVAWAMEGSGVLLTENAGATWRELGALRRFAPPTSRRSPAATPPRASRTPTRSGARATAGR